MAENTIHHARLFLVGQAGFHQPDETVETSLLTIEQFGISDARDLKEAASRAPQVGTHRRFCITLESITVEAQNALLKLFEDPPETARFELSVPKEDILIGTLRSRLQYEQEVQVEINVDTANSFLKASLQERLDEIAARTKAKDQVWISDLLNGLETIAGSDTEAREALLLVRQYIDARGASKKMLLEHVALSLTGAK